MANNNPNTLHLAEQIYNALQDMDYPDYAETAEKDFKCLVNDLKLLHEHGNGALLYAIEMLIEN